MRPAHRYLGAIWQQQWVNLESKVRGPLPRIHPVVFYHGEPTWTTPLELAGLHSPEDPVTAPFITDLVYRLVDLHTIQPERLRLAARTLAYMITLRYVLRPFSPPAARMILKFIMDPEVERSIREQLLKYLLDNTRDENTDTLLTEWERAGYTIEGGNIMTMAQELVRRGKEEGLEEGREEGQKEGREEVVHRMRANGFTVEAIGIATGLSKEQIAALKNGTDKNAQ